MKIFKLTALAIFIFVGIFPVIGQSLREFSQFAEKYGLQTEIPVGFIEAKIIDNDDMEYSYALKYPKKEYEVRYAIRPIKYPEMRDDSLSADDIQLINFRNTYYQTVAQTTVMNLTGGRSYQMQIFDPQAVQKEFGADWGATTFFELDSDFGKGYKYCLMVVIHKKDVADAYYFYTSNTKKDFETNMQPFFHSLTFK